MKGGIVINNIGNIFWAKKKEENGLYKWLPLGQHLEDTRKVAVYLWNHWLSSGQKLIVINTLETPSEDIALKLVNFLAATHDIGKALPSFQTKLGYNNSKDLDILLIEKLIKNGFENLSEESFLFSSNSPHALAGQFFLKQFGINEQIASIVGGHHGKPVDHEDQITDQLGYSKNYYQVEDKSSLVYTRWKNIQAEILKRALEISGFESTTHVPTISQPGQVILSGLLIMADWIASNDRFFPLIDIGNEVIINSQTERLAYGIEQWGLYKSIEFHVQSDIHSLYLDRFGFEPKSFQKKFSEVIDSVNDGGIFILEAPMGLGKTEAALIAAEQLANRKGRGGIFFGLPTQATSNGLFPRISNWLERLQEEYGQKISIQLAHGKADLNEVYNNLINTSLTYGDVQDDVSVNQWFIGRKKKILDDIVVGTVDQFLLAALKQKHLALRHLGFSKKVVIIDEVHAYDAYMSQYLNEALTWMGAYDVPVIILSATLPAKKREELIIAYLKGKDLKNKDIFLPKEGLLINDYPLITFNDGNEIKQFRDFEELPQKDVKIIPLNENNIEELLQKKMEHEGVIGIVCNTVLKAQKIAKRCMELFGDEQVELLHSSFIASDRAKKEENLLNMIGKDANRPTRKIIIGTQVIEQSLDIDFDVMISELAPMDLLIQRVGRLHRHELNRAEEYKTPTLYVMGMSETFEFDKGSISVYGEYLLFMTQYYLPKVFTIPKDISELVQKVYTDATLHIEENSQIIINNLKEKYNNTIKSKEERAKSYKLLDPVYKETFRRKSSLIGWLENTNSNDSEEFGYAQVRDSQETIEVIAIKKMEGGYGLFGTKELISNRIAENRVALELAKQTLRLPLILTKFEGRINATIKELEDYNNQYLANWQEHVWLKGNLGIMFDDNNEFELNGYLLYYDEKFGLSYERKDPIGKI